MKRIKLVPVQFKMFGEMIGGIMSLVQGKKQKAAGEKRENKALFKKLHKLS